MSDTHDHIWRLESALPHLAQAAAVLHCGDLISPFMIHKLAAGIADLPVHLVWGNNDGDRHAVSQAAAGYANFTIHGEFASLELGGLRIALNHYPEIAMAVAASGAYDLVCYGHDHTAHQEQRGQTLLLNPGEVMGLNGRSSLVLYDTSSRRLTWVDLD
jgi:putative phosphoesterase